MKILYYDCFAGISGDMNLGAMIDLGVDKEYLINELAKLKIDSEYKIRVEKRNKSGIQGTKVDVILNDGDLDNQENHHEHESNSHDHIHQHSDHHNHDHDDNNCHEHKHHHHNHKQGHEHIHRNLKDIETIINSSELNDKVKRLSLDMFMEVAKAEAKVHGKDLYDVHFHEVGAIDSIIDIVGAAICIDYLKPDRIVASQVEVGGGFVRCAHGLIPVPAPATVEILKGVPIRSGIVPFETTTPTGAAILAANVDEYEDKINFIIEKIGYGLGTRELDIPNVLRVYIARQGKKKQ
ncbi:nickel pincer cofactor biosynthesis protein LarC [Maledivibacter halophilus]|uniref:TIGR00299 family protein n=1 Tax=Maledivibacter halophilus TaxID=36842 RepID=A0A1T5M847_9FIRM|nr:nickel pincer cofactor biosynthesis protein LarC [Maledivibacter halophilus]SKC84184.1 TIGR00299 family protein [Maledivibacter halophilus]